MNHHQQIVDLLYECRPAVKREVDCWNTAVDLGTAPTGIKSDLLARVDVMLMRLESQSAPTELVEALALLRRAKGFVNKYPSIGAQALSVDIAEFLAVQGGSEPC